MFASVNFFNSKIYNTYMQTHTDIHTCNDGLVTTNCLVLGVSWLQDSPRSNNTHIVFQVYKHIGEYSEAYTV